MSFDAEKALKWINQSINQFRYSIFEFWHLDPCGQDISRTMESRLLKLSMYTSYGKGKKAIYFQGQGSNFKITGPL